MNIESLYLTLPIIVSIILLLLGLRVGKLGRHIIGIFLAAIAIVAFVLGARGIVAEQEISNVIYYGTIFWIYGLLGCFFLFNFKWFRLKAK